MKKRLANLHPIFLFLGIEFLALCSFNLGGNNLIFYLLGFALAIFGGVLTIKRFRKDELFSLLFLALPVLLIAVFVSFGRLSWGNSILVNISAFLGIISFFALGLFLRRTNKIKTETLLIAIAGGLALLVLISTVYTWFAYGPFYVLRFKDTPYYFYDGVAVDVTKEGGWLNGFNFSEVSLKYSGLFGVLLTSSFVGTMFINPKKNLRDFILSGVFGFVGFLSLISAPNFSAMIYMIPIFLVAGIVKVLNLDAIPQKAKTIIRRIISISFGVGVGFVVVFFIIAYLNASGYSPATGFIYDAKGELPAAESAFAQFIRNNHILHKIFNNHSLMAPINNVLVMSTISDHFFGFINNMNSWYALRTAISTSSGVFEIEIIKEGGIFAFIVLIFFLVFVVQNIFRYGKNSKDSPLSKGIIISVMIGFLIYCSLDYDVLPYIHESSNYASLFRTIPGLLFLFFVGYIFYPDLKPGTIPAFEEEMKVDESEPVIQKNNIDDEYSFSIDESEETKDED